MMRSLLAAIPFLLPLSAFAEESVYTKLDLNNNCVFHSSYEAGGSAYCTGYKGYPVHFSEGDLRQMIRFGHIAKLDGQWESFNGFNAVGETIEWRLKDRIPFATILRWYVDSPDGEGPKGQVLVISKVASHKDPNSCVVGYVDARANKNANVIARDVADRLAESFVCGVTSPAFHGKTNALSPQPTGHFN